MNYKNIKYIFIDTSEKCKEYINSLNTSDNDKDVHIIFKYDKWDDYSYQSTFDVMGWSNHKLVYLSNYFKFMKVEKKASYSNIVEEMKKDDILNREFTFDDSILRNNNYISISNYNFKENLSLFCSFAYMNNKSRFDMDDLKDDLKNKINVFIKSIQDIAYNALLTSKQLDGNEIFKKSLLRDFRMYNLHKVNRLDILWYKQRYLKQLSDIRAKINKHDDIVSRVSLLFLALSQLEMYLKDIIQLKINVIKTNINDESDNNKFVNDLIDNYMKNMNNRWNTLTQLFNQLYKINPNDFIGNQSISMHQLRNKLAHSNNEILINDDELECDNKSISINKLMIDIKEFFEKIYDKLVDSEFVI